MSCQRNVTAKCHAIAVHVQSHVLYWIQFDFCVSNHMDAMDEPPYKKRRGGIKQRLAAMDREDPGNTKVTSELAKSFLHKWAWGQLSPQDVQEYSGKACKDFRLMQVEPPSDLDFFAKLGTDGQYKCLAEGFGKKN